MLSGGQMGSDNVLVLSFSFMCKEKIFYFFLSICKKLKFPGSVKRIVKWKQLFTPLEAYSTERIGFTTRHLSLIQQMLKYIVGLGFFMKYLLLSFCVDVNLRYITQYRVSFYCIQYFLQYHCGFSRYFYSPTLRLRDKT